MPKAGLFAGEVTPQAPADDSPTTKQKGYWWMEYGGYVPGNCNEIWEIGTLIPDLHVGGIANGAWNGDVINGIGVLKDARIDNIDTPNDRDNYTLYAGFNPGVEDGVAEVFYPECQWYDYAGPRLKDGMSGFTNDLTGVGWLTVLTPVITFDQVGITGSANSASLLTDDNGSGTEAAYKLGGSNAIPVLSTEPVTGVFVIRKEVTAPHYSRFRLQNSNSPFKHIAVIFNVASGSLTIDSTSTGDDLYAEVREIGDWWEVYIQVDGDASAANNGEVALWPAWNTDGTDSSDTSATGSIVVGNVSFFAEQSAGINGVAISNARGGAIEPKPGSGGSVIDQSRCFLDSSNHDNTEGGFYLEFRPLYGHSEIDYDIEILSLDDSEGLLYYDYSTQLLTATDGTNTATVPLTLVAETKYRVGVIWGDFLRVGVDQIWGTAVAYDGAFAGGSDLTVCRNPLNVNYWREFRGFQVTYTEALNEITDLMAGDPLNPVYVYDPEMMTFNGSDSYYEKTGIATSGNKVSWVVKFNIASFTGGGIMRIAQARQLRLRLLVYALSSDHATVTSRDKIAIIVQNSAGTTICNIFSVSDLVDGQDHVGLFSYDGDLGISTFVIDNIDETDAANPLHVLTTGTLETANITFTVGATAGGGDYVDGQIGYCGYSDVYLTDGDDWMNGNTPLSIDTHGWVQWKGEPRFWQQFSKMDESIGANGIMTANGTITGPS